MRNIQEIKGNLARLLATENLLVEHKQVPTASFNVEKRVLTLPMWNRASETVYTMLVGHEVGHALFTPNSDLLDNLPCPKDYVNVTEDARIEKLMKRKFPGLSKDFYGGYKELNEQDFFCIQKEDLSKMTLIDRVNLHYKIGAYAMLPFSESERPLCDAVGDAETFQEAIDAAVAIYEYSKKESKKQQNSEKQQNSVTPSPQGEQQSSDLTHEEMLEEAKRREQENENTDTESNQSRPWDDNSDDGEDEGNGDNSDADLDTPSYEYNQPDINNVSTQSNFDSAAQSLIDDNATTPTYVTYPKFDMSRIITPNNLLWDAAEEDWNSYSEANIFAEVDYEFNQFCNSTAKDVNYLVKEFECKKSASAYARSSTSRTGVLDLGKLHTYKFNDDIFRKITRTPDGKNHGLVFLLDWSGSMACELFDTCCQVINLAQFCKKVGIPFDVYSFVTDHSQNRFFDIEPGTEYEEIPDIQETRNAGEFWLDKRFKLVNLLTSEGNSKNFKRQCRNLYRVANYWNPNKLYSFRPSPPYFLGLGGTPLNDALVVMYQYLGEWQQKAGVEKSHLIILSDGESQCCVYGKDPSPSQYFEKVYPTTLPYGTVIRTKNRYFTGVENANSSTTNVLLRVLRTKYSDSSILGFRICSTRSLSHYLHVLGVEYKDHDKYSKIFKRDRSAVIEGSSYTELYVIKSHSYQSDVEMEVDEDATKSQIKSAFRKSLKSKSINRKMLSSFAGQIA